MQAISRLRRSSGAERLRAGAARLVSEPASRPATGHVDGVANGEIFGWIRDPEGDEGSRAISVYEGQSLVARGEASTYRADLEQAGIGDGRHAFSLALDASLFDGRKHSLVVRFDDRPCALPAASFVVESFARTRIEAIEGNWMRGVLEIARPDDVEGEGFPLELLADDRVIATGGCARLPGNTHRFSIELPADIADDELHVFRVRIPDRACVAEPFVERVSSIRTPWVHLRDSGKVGALGAVSRVAGLRYTALQRQLRRFSAGKIDAAALADVQSAHDRLVEGYEGRRSYPTLTLPATERPLASIVIPVHDKFALTYHCIASLILTAGDAPFEVIVVDDLSEDETAEIESIVENVRVVRNATNLGFLRSCRAGASEGRGTHLVFLNNDTEVADGWLDAMFAVTRRFADVGAVGSKLIYPDGRLQEAGGIVWGNGKPWNIGNGKNPEAPEFNYARQADYLSGASLLVSREVWDKVDGFSEELAPAYYEDTDIAFKIREAGYRTFYCPESVVVHFEGMSNGRDTSVGIKRFQNINAPRFRARWRHAYRHNGTEGQALLREMDRNVDFRALVIDNSTPHPDHDAGSYAAVQEMTLLQELGCKVTFLPNNFAHMGRYTLAMQARGIECVHAPFYASPADFIAQRGMDYDLVYITRYDVAEQVIPLIRQHSRAKIIFNNADLHFLRELRATLAGDGSALEGVVQTRDRELSVMRQVDAVLSYNETEHAVIASHNLASDNVFKCPWVLRDRRSDVPFSQREGIAFLGGYNHTPNREAVIWFVESVMPRLRAADSGIRFHVYGSNVPPEIAALACEDVIIEGFVEDLSDVFDRSRVFIAPLLSGAGIKGKVLESIAHGVPSVLTSIAAEATGLTHDHSAFIVDDPESWVESITRLYRDDALWRSMSDAAHALVQTRYGFDDALESMAEVLRHVQLEPAERRAPLFKQPEDYDR